MNTHELKGLSDAEIAEKIEGRSDDIPLPNIESRMLKYNLEQCPSCGTWVKALLRIPENSDEPDNACDWCR
jgi:hypothetical protein